MSWIDVNGVSLNFRLEGDSNGPLVVMLHEIGGTLESFQGVTPHLEPYFNVLSFDQRGSGQSEKVLGQIGIDDLVGDIAGLVNALVGSTEPCNFVTVAAAGLQALRFFEIYPERVRSIAMCNPALGVDPARAGALGDRADFVEKNGIRAGLDTTLEKSYPEGLRDKVIFPNFRGRYLANDPHGFAEANRVLARTDLRHLIPTLDCKVMVAAGTEDQVRPSAGSQELAAQIEGSQFVLIEGGHFLPTTAPTALGEALVQFLLK